MAESGELATVLENAFGGKVEPAKVINLH
jgi:hypothetical protein